MVAQQVVLKSYEFRREREASWRELEDLINRVEKNGVKALSAEQLSRLPILYRATLSSLSVARSISLDRNVVDYLESLCGRAYFCVYGTRRQLRDATRDFFGHQFPAAVRRHKWAVLVAAFFMFLGAMTAFLITLDNQDRFYTFVSESYAQGRGPSTSTADLKAVLYDTGGGSADTLTRFATFLFTHNAKIGIISFALGFVLGVPVFFFMFINGLVLGAFAALHHARGLSVDLWGWLLPHGVTELLAVILCGGAGLVLAHSLVFPGRHTRLTNLGIRGREAGQIVFGAVIMLFIAGLIEGIFRQSVQSVPVRYVVASSTAVFWIYYFGFVGRSRQRAEDAATGRAP